MYVLNVTILKKSLTSRETLKSNSHASISPSLSTKYTTGLSTLWELSMQSLLAVRMGRAELRFWWPVLIFPPITLNITIWSPLCTIQWQRLSLYTSLSTHCLPRDKAELSPLFRTLFYTELYRNTARCIIISIKTFFYFYNINARNKIMYTRKDIPLFIIGLFYKEFQSIYLDCYCY